MTKNRPKQLGVVRSLDGDSFDILAGVLFEDMYGVLRTAPIPHAMVKLRTTYVVQTKNHKSMPHDDVWLAKGTGERRSHTQWNM
ncbi:hypothetical protein [Bradyrhizobium liaoningense]